MIIAVTSYALGKLFATRNRKYPRTNILAYFRAKWRLYIYPTRARGINVKYQATKQRKKESFSQDLRISLLITLYKQPIQPIYSLLLVNQTIDCKDF